ncbi:hypothetical protein [Paraburkholderia oxyphila]|uniref:hypothetical protein n=1 Tax=Paraburkholderia oxyphila TaxID=614212 RepID=UPI000483BDD5|nr:hypothetical protein [Paraburkholderia oxyphila]
MRDIPHDVPVAPPSMPAVGARMMQLGFDQFAAAQGLQAKRAERDRAAAQRACEAFQHACSNDVKSFAQTWQILMREYLAASVGLWEQSLSAAARNQAAYGALLRDMVLDAEQAWTRTGLTPKQA